jgi:pimeloyl-ACP methyl ester carboxylesterase
MAVSGGGLGHHASHTRIIRFLRRRKTMPIANDRVETSELTVTIDARSQRLSYFNRPGEGRAILYVHGLGCSKADFLGLTEEPKLDPFRLISYDHPGCGDSPYDPAMRTNIDFLVEVLEGFIRGVDLKKFLLVGGSMGGLIGLLYAERNPSRITGYVNIEGNLAPEDCMFSRKVVPHEFDHFESVVFPGIKRSLSARKNLAGFSRHLEVLARSNPHAYYDHSFQTVEYSDNGNLLERFIALPVPKYFVYGSENRQLPYLPRLRQSDCRVVEIPNADHFLFYDNPKALAETLADLP